ncbi:MAG: GNAT family N-acetyltransferase [Candidatus Woesearchaeota archaeon]
MNIRKATKLDFETLCDLRKEYLKDTKREQKIKTSDKNIEIYLSRDYSTFFIAFDKNKAIGYIHGTIDPKPQEHVQSYIQDIFVKKEYRKKGIGKKLLDKMHNHFKKKNTIPGLNVDILNKCAIKFYQKQGYVIKERKENILHMIKQKEDIPKQDKKIVKKVRNNTIQEKVVMVYPPFCTPASPPYSITSLGAFIKNNFEGEIKLIDLNIFFHKKIYPSYHKFFRDINNINDLDKYKKTSDEFYEVTKNDYSKNNRHVLEDKRVDLIDECLKEILKHQPDIVAFSLVYSSQVFYTKALIDKLNEKKIKVVIGGPAANKKIECDAILNNEIEFLEYLTNKKTDHDKLNFKTIPDFSCYNKEDYFIPKLVYPIRTSYACFYGQCTFCTHHGNECYMEINLEHFKETVIKNKAKYLFIIDDMISRKRLLEIAKILKPLDVKWFCQLRPTNDLSKDILETLYESGLRMVIWGLESASNRLLKLMKKGTNIECAEIVLKEAKEIGIKNVLYVMFGFPTETREEFWMTRDFLEKNTKIIDLVSTSVFGLQQGSEIYFNPDKFGINEVNEEERTFLGPKITYTTKSEMNQKLAIKLQSRSQHRIYAVNKYPRMMNFFREHMLLVSDK